MSYHRFRTDGGFTSEDLIYRKINSDCATTSWYNANTAKLKVGEYREMADSLVPSFKKRQKAGEVFFNDLAYSKWKYFGGGQGPSSTSVNVQCTQTGAKERTEYNGNWLGWQLPGVVKDGVRTVDTVKLISDSDITNLENEVMTEALNQRGRADANLFESLAEFDKTLGMLGPLTGKLNDKVDRLNRDIRRMGGRAAAQQEIAGMWLMTRYGIKPLVSDVIHVLENLSAKVQSKRISTRSKDTISVSSQVNISSSLNYCGFVYNRKVIDTYTVRAMCLDDVILTELNQLGFTFKGFVTLPWELLSLSFVADWFANVGSFIGSLVPAPGWNSRGACYTGHRIVTNDFAVNGGSSVNLYPTSLTLDRPMTGTFNHVYERKIRYGRVAPQLVLKNSFKFDRATRVADALALVAGRLARVSNVLEGARKAPPKRLGRVLEDANRRSGGNHVWY